MQPLTLAMGAQEEEKRFSEDQAAANAAHAAALRDAAAVTAAAQVRKEPRLLVRPTSCATGRPL